MNATYNHNAVKPLTDLKERARIVQAIDAAKTEREHMPIYALCREFGIELYQYYTWRRRVTKQQAPNVEKPEAPPVVVPQVLIVVVSGPDVNLNDLVDQARRLNVTVRART